MKNFVLAFAMALFMAGIITACTQTSVDSANTTSLAEARIGSVSSTSGVSGTCVKGTSETVVSASSLPTAVLTYLSTTYPGYTIVQAEQGTNLNGGATYYEVKFTYNGATKELHFDMTGAVIATRGRNGKGKGGSGNTEVVITADKLPAASLTYLSTNYAGYTLVQAEQGTTSAGVTYYEVKFTYNSKIKEIHFDATGALI